MIVYRLSKAIHSNDLSGTGAEKNGGRWNSKGVAMIYTSQSRALCIAEVAVHLPMGILPEDYEMISINIPGRSIFSLPEIQLPKDWKSIPPAQSTKTIGDQFIKNQKQLTMKVPSMIVKDEYNFVINPKHLAMKEVRIICIEPFEFDSRLLGLKR
ncbi:MAG TPA: RES family NAD+ phosphorylase [Saprospiraceae bacterium]|nr:RES family NAD+ phosphorylase [Saprospiraceae bacterium]